MDIKKTKISRVELVGTFEEEYVYDIGIKGNTPYFFGNNILVHNSCYFSAYEALKDNPEFKDFKWERDKVVEYYDAIGDAVNESFPQFMVDNFHVPLDNGKIIAAARETVASKGLFISKKRYALMVVDDEGTKLDVGNKPGKIKGMGIETKRSDTSKYMQEFLEDVLQNVLIGASEDEVINQIKKFRKEFRKMDPWLKGTPKAVKNLDYYTKIYENGCRDSKGKKKTIPGHVRASINWNKLRKMNGDNYSMPISDGYKIIVCQLKPNALKMSSVAYPVDELHLPQWFKELPFDDEAMEDKVVTTKLNNLIGILNWDLDRAKDDTTFGNLFSF